MQVSIVVPTYKQEKTIQEDIQSIYNTMKQTRWEFEIIVVVDGIDVDDSYENAKKVKLPNISVVGYKTNRGKGYAIRYGSARAKGQYIVFIDAGMDIKPNGISLILEHMEWYDADVCVASKRHQASKVTGYPFVRKLYTWGYHIFVKLLFNLPIKDTQAGLKVYKREVLEKVLPRLVVKKFAFDVEVLGVAYSLGYKKMYDTPVELSLSFGEGSNFNPLFFLNPAIRDMFLDTLAVFYRMKILGYYSDENKRRWKYDKELQMRVNTGE